MGHHHAGHAHRGANHNRAFAIGLTLNLGFVLVETAFGYLGHSLALIADAGHNLSDVLGLGLAWGASALTRRAPTDRFTYGLGRSSILAALANALVLLVVTGGLAWEAAQRLGDPGEVAGGTMIAVALVGVAINGLSAWLFAAGQKGDLNLRGAFLHLVSDALVSLGVVISGAVILATGWRWFDPLASLVVAGVIVLGTWQLLSEALHLALDGVPAGVNSEAVRAHLAGLPGVEAVHDLHIWGLSTTEAALTAHLVIPAGHPGDGFLCRVADELHDRFGIEHTTLQIETGDPCALGHEWHR